MPKRTITIDDIRRETKQGSKGPFQSVRVKTGEHWVYLKNGEWNSSWKVGDEVEINVEPKTGAKGTYYVADFGRITKKGSDPIMEKLDRILFLLGDKPKIVEKSGDIVEQTSSEEVPF